MIHTILRDAAIVLGVVAATVLALIIGGVMLISKDAADGNNPFE